ncbi:MAG: prepilin-type N-terminal cleavage/methylation domain-containing protein [Nitrospina sp.]|jgi:type IV fimbrial biogenesis protein FimT|nr:prepilin-type N-terminal cleavage/methylation domain-containing protein [Nitrospina sp.]
MAARKKRSTEPSILERPNSREVEGAEMKRNAGFTLMEMMIVVAVFGIIAAVAIPAFMSLLPGMRLNGSARDIFMVMSQTRMQAVSKNTIGVVKFNPSNNSFTAWLDDGPAGNNWALDSTDTLIKSGSTETGVSISNTTIPYHTFGYNSRGLPAGTPGAYDITLTNSKGETQKVEVNAFGTVKML